jgi:tRNA (guanine-N7-)-methyltransferase
MITPPSDSASIPLPPPDSLILRPVSYVQCLDLSVIYPRSQPLEVELGSGDGGFLVAWAAQRSDHNFLGVERLLGRIRKIDRKGRRAHLSNLRLLRLEAGYFLEYLLPRESVEVLHVYFPDPWPKRRHWARRLVSERFPELVHRALVPGGRVYLRTDNHDYFEQMQRVFSLHSAFVRVEPPAELAGLRTDFERDFAAQGIPILSAAYGKPPR